MRAERTAPGLEERLRQVIEEDAGGSSSQWAGMVGIPKSVVSDWLNKGASITTKNLFRIAHQTDLNLGWLLTGQGPHRLSDGHSVTAVQEWETPYSWSDGEYLQVPRVVPMDQESGQVIQSEQIVTHLAFRADWIRGVMGLDDRRLALIATRGDSMEPTLKEGDLLLLDLRVTRVHNDAIYVLRRNSDLIAKRIQRRFDGTLLIKSDNPAYETQVVPPEQGEQLEIIGRVVWNGRRL